MCRRVQCTTCDRPTFAGCGMHVDQVLGDVPPGDRCPGHEAPTRSEGGGSWFSRVLGR